MSLSRFARYAWVVVAYNILVFLWGAFVRATGSGAGCGDHWPLCNGQVIPRPDEIETVIEFSHRVTSGIALLMVVGLLIWALRLFPKGHIVRVGAIASMILMIIEALIGAGLVLLQLVADNVSVARAFALALHLANTFLLLAAMTLTAWWASGGAAPIWRGQTRKWLILLPAFIGTLLVGSTGAVTALGDSLLQLCVLPGTVAQPAEGNFLVDLRYIHPILGMLMGAYSLVLASMAVRQVPSRQTWLLAWGTASVFVFQILLGGINVYLQAPVWMQLVHLFFADIAWMLLVLLGAVLLASPAPITLRQRQSQTTTAD